MIRGEFDAIAARRSPPQVFLVDDRGELLAWPARSAGSLAPEVDEVVRRYVSHPAGQIDVVELIRAGDDHIAVRIIPQQNAPSRTFIVIVERFALRRLDAMDGTENEKNRRV
jgi:hypothetical protein